MGEAVNACVDSGLLLLFVDMVETFWASGAIIFRSAAILLDILALDSLSVALNCVSSTEAFWLLDVADAKYVNAYDVSVWYAGAGVWVFKQ